MMAEASFAPLKTITTPAASNIEPPTLAPGLVESSLIKTLLAKRQQQLGPSRGKVTNSRYLVIVQRLVRQAMVASETGSARDEFERVKPVKTGHSYILSTMAFFLALYSSGVM